MSALLQDLRFAARVLRGSPGLSAIIVVTLALAIGANTAVFSIVYGMWFRPLGVPGQDRLVHLYNRVPSQGWDRHNVSPLDYVDWREQSTSFAGMGAYFLGSSDLIGGDGPLRVSVVHATASLLPVLGFQTQLGRIYGDEQDRPGRGDVVLLSDGFWRRQFGADPGIVGQRVVLENVSSVVLGVLPPQLDKLWEPFDIWVPSALDANAYQRDDHFLMPMARLKPGVTVAEAQREMSGIVDRLAATYPESNEGYGANVLPLIDKVVDENAQTALTALAAAVGFVLLIACLNVANILLASGGARQREFAVRAALGASKGRLVRQAITECAVLSIVGGALGLLLALWGVELLRSLVPDTVPRKAEIAVDERTLWFTLLLSLLAAFVFGLVPALRSAGVDVIDALKGETRSASVGRTRRWGRDALVVGQVALALALVTGAGLMIKSFLRLQAVEPGFAPEHLLTMQMKVPDYRYPEEQQRAAFIRDVLREVGDVPGVMSAAAVSTAPLGRSSSSSVATVEDHTPAKGAAPVHFGYVVVSPGYFETMGIRLVAGRDFNEQDDLSRDGVVIVSENLARRFWPDEDPIGKRLKYGPRESDVPWRTVIGVVGNVRHSGLAAIPRLETYRPHAQTPNAYMTIVARTAGEPAAASASVQHAIWNLDPDQAVYRVATMNDLVFDDIGVWGVFAGILTVLASIGLVLAAVGLYGVVSYNVSQRRREIGIRMALGARSPDVLRLVVTRSAYLTLLGLGVGVVLASALGGVLESLMYSVSPADPATFAGVALLLILVALVATYLPARRATKVDPMVALRCE